MGAKIDRLNGQNYSDNLIDNLLSFNESATYSVSSGTGSAIIDTSVAFKGNSSLKIQNTDPTNDLVITQSTQNSIITQTGVYGVSLFILKTEVDEFMTLELRVFQNAVLFDTQTFVLGSETTEDDINNTWVRFDCFEDYNFVVNDKVTFTWNLKGKAGTSLLNTTIWVDGMMIYRKSRLNNIPPSYIESVFNKTLQSSNVLLDNLTVNQYNLLSLNTAPSSASDTGYLGQILIDGDYVYVCTATNTWKRVAITTW